MPFIRKLKDGRWYVCRKAIEYDGSIGRYVRRAGEPSARGHPRKIRTVFSPYVKNIKGTIFPCLTINKIVFPREFMGKKVRFVMEVVEPKKGKEEKDAEETPTQN